MKVGVVIPSYYNENWEKFITRLKNSLQYISNVDNLIFLINFQNMPNEADSVQEAFLKTIITMNSTWDFKVKVSPKYNPVSMCKIRNDCMMMDPDCDLYLFIDDDVYFKEGSGEQYNQVINEFEDDPSLGMVMCAGYLGGYNYVGKLKYDYSKYWMTNRGLFFRNIHRSDNSPIYPADIFDYYLGGYEDLIVAFEIFKAKLKTATMFNSPTQHPQIAQMEDKDADTADEIHDVDVSRNSVEEYLRREYGEEVKITGANSIRKFLRDMYRKGMGYQYE